MNLYSKSLAYFSAHPILNSIAHFTGGFGLAILLQQFIKGHSLFSPWVAWVCLGVSIFIHMHSFMKK